MRQNGFFDKDKHEVMIDESEHVLTTGSGKIRSKRYTKIEDLKGMTVCFCAEA